MAKSARDAGNHFAEVRLSAGGAEIKRGRCAERASRFAKICDIVLDPWRILNYEIPSEISDIVRFGDEIKNEK